MKVLWFREIWLGLRLWGAWDRCYLSLLSLFWERPDQAEGTLLQLLRPEQREGEADQTLVPSFEKWKGNGATYLCSRRMLLPRRFWLWLGSSRK